MEAQERSVVTGLGLVSPIGLSVETFWQAMMCGKSGAALLTRFDATSFKTRFACELKDFDPLDYMSRKQASRLDRFCQYALTSAQQAVEDAQISEGISEAKRDRFAVVFGSGIGGLGMLEKQSQVLLQKGAGSLSPFMIPMMMGNVAPALIAKEYGFRGPNHGVVSACSTGNDAIRDAALLLRQGYADLVVCGGSEAAITPLGLGGFAAMRALSTCNDAPERTSRPLDKDRDGFVLGEGAGTLILETLSRHAQARGANIYAELLGFGASCDAYHYAAPDPTGAGVMLAIQRALQDAELAPESVDYINMHATSTPLGDLAELKAIQEVFGTDTCSLKLSATKSMTGHLLGAAGAVEAISTILTIQHNVIPPTINVQALDPECDLNYVLQEPQAAPVDIVLSNAFDFGRHNTSVVFKRFEEAEL